MRKLWIACGVLLVLVAAAGTMAVASLYRLVAANQAQLITQAQTVLGRPVSVGRTAVSLWGGISVRLDEVRIGDDPRFGSDDFVHVGALIVHTAFWPLLRGRFVLGRISARQLHINVIRDAGGQWNYTTLRPVATAASAALAPALVLVANTPIVPGTAFAIPFAIRGIAASDATLMVVDRTQNPIRTIAITQIDASVHSRDPTSPIELSLGAAVMSEGRNLAVRVSVGPWDGSAMLPIQLDGRLGPFGPQQVQIDAVRVAATIAAERLQVSELTGRLFGGSFSLNGSYSWQGDAPFTLKGRLQDIALADVMSANGATTSQRLGGTAGVTLDVRGNGTTAQTVAASLTGSVVADVQNGIIKGINLADEVLKRLSKLPVVGRVASEKIRPKYARLFTDPDTHFETLHGTLVISDQRVRTDDVTIGATDYGVDGHGWVTFDRQMNMASTLRLSPSLSRAIVADVKATKYLLDEREQLAVPFHLIGTLGEAKPKLDNDDIVAMVERGAARGGVKDLFDEGLRRLFKH